MLKPPTVDGSLATFTHPLAAELKAVRSILNSPDGPEARIMGISPSCHHGGGDVGTVMAVTRLSILTPTPAIEVR